MPIHPVILSGGSGTRLWPLSRAAYPKQLMPLVADVSLLQATVGRVGEAARFAPPLLICNEDHRFLVAEQLRELAVTPRAIVLEPAARNTAPAIAAAALILAEADPAAVMLVLPSDHHIGAPERFLAAVAAALPAAEAGRLVAFGVAASRPETGYGYIRRGAPLAGAPGCFAVERFVEKPDRATAERYVADGSYAWNGGMFLLRADRLLDELGRFEPELVAAVRRAVAEARRDLDFLRLDPAAFRAAPDRSIDYAVMERTDRAAMVPVEMDWTDVGSWSALWEVSPKDAAGNALVGDVIAADLKNCYVRGDSRLVAAVGLEDVILIDTADAVLAVHRGRAQDIKRVVDTLKQTDRSEHLQHRRVYRPWGTYEQVDLGARHQVKRIVVKPGARLSLQKHARRAEYWVVVAGRARVTRDDQVFELAENESTFIPLGAVHRLENPGDEPLHLIEVQSGSYLGEDDIVRIDDSYGRS